METDNADTQVSVRGQIVAFLAKWADKHDPEAEHAERDELLLAILERTEPEMAALLRDKEHGYWWS